MSTTESALDTSLSPGGREACVWVCAYKQNERIVMDETGTYVVQSVRRVPEEQRYDHRLLQSVRGTPWEPNPGDVSTDLPLPMLITPQLLDVEPAPTQTYHSDNRGTRNIYIRKIDLERFGHTAGCTACEVHRWITDAGKRTHCGMQGTTRRRDDDRRIYIDPRESDTCETGGTHHQKLE